MRERRIGSNEQSKVGGIAVGSSAFVDNIKSELGLKAMHRKVHFRSEHYLRIQFKFKPVLSEAEGSKIKNWLGMGKRQVIEGEPDLYLVFQVSDFVVISTKTIVVLGLLNGEKPSKKPNDCGNRPLH